MRDGGDEAFFFPAFVPDDATADVVDFVPGALVCRLKRCEDMLILIEITCQKTLPFNKKKYSDTHKDSNYKHEYTGNSANNNFYKKKQIRN